jgi:pilus assembly protein CpaB
VVNRRLVGLIVALVLAGVATFLLINFVNSADERARTGEELATVFVAQGDITAGTSADDAAAQGLIAQDDVPARTVPAGAIGSLESIAGQVAVGPIFEGEILVAGRFGSTAASATGLIDIPEGLQAVTVDAGVLEGVAGFVQAGDQVSVVATVTDVDEEDGSEEARTQYLLQNAQVLAVGRRVPAQQTEDGAGEDQIQQQGERYVFTLGMDPVSIEQLIFAYQQGQVWFTLLPDSDDGEDLPEVDTPGRTLTDLFD